MTYVWSLKFMCVMLQMAKLRSHYRRSPDCNFPEGFDLSLPGGFSPTYPDSFTSAMLPVLGERSSLVGYVAAGFVLGLVQVMEGSAAGQFVWAQERAVKVDLGGGQLPHGRSALAFLAGRGRGMKTVVPFSSHPALRRRRRQAAPDREPRRGPGR